MDGFIISRYLWKFILVSDTRLDMCYMKFNEQLSSPDSGEKNVKMCLHYLKISFSSELKYGVALVKTISGNNNVIIPYKNNLNDWSTFSDSLSQRNIKCPILKRSVQEIFR